MSKVFFLNIKAAADVINAVADGRQPHFQAPPDQYAEPLPFITLWGTQPCVPVGLADTQPERGLCNLLRLTEASNRTRAINRWVHLALINGANIVSQPPCSGRG